MSDKNLRRKIIEKLHSHTEYNTERVVVKVHQGVVELSGHVDGENAQASLEALVRSMDLVSDVVNLLRVQNGSTTGVQGISVR